MAESTFNPATSSGGASVDAQVNRDVLLGESWATIIATVNGDTTASDNAATAIQVRCRSAVGGWDRIQWSILTFDTSSLPNDATITAVTFRLYTNTVAATVTGLTLVVVGTTPASDNAVVAADYDNYGATAFSDTLDVDSLPTGQYNTWTLTADGRAAVSLTGVTKLGIMFSNHRAGTEPTDTSGETTVAFDSTDGTNKPELVVTYTQPTTTSTTTTTSTSSSTTTTRSTSTSTTTTSTSTSSSTTTTKSTSTSTTTTSTSTSTSTTRSTSTTTSTTRSTSTTTSTTTTSTSTSTSTTRSTSTSSTQSTSTTTTTSTSTTTTVSTSTTQTTSTTITTTTSTSSSTSTTLSTSTSTSIMSSYRPVIELV